MICDALGEILSRYGQTVELHFGGEGAGVAVRAFLQPILEKGTDRRQELPTPFGRVRQDRFLYLGDPEASLEGLAEQGWIEWRGEKYDVLCAQPVYLGGAVSHWWAVLRPRDEEAA